MISFIVRRFINYLILTFLATIGAYSLSSMLMDPRERYLNRNPPLSKESINAIMDAHGTNPNTPVLERIGHWLHELFLHGSLGDTIHNDAVMHEMLLRSSISLRLLIVGSILGALVGVILGVWGAVKQYKASDQTVSYISFVVIAAPTFVVGAVLMILATKFNNLIGVQLINFSGEYSTGVHGFWPILGDRLSHMLLPTLALIMFAAAGFSRYQRSIMLDVLGQDYIRTARSKGRTRRSALVRHGVRMAVIPMSTYFAYYFGTLIAGALFLEVLFSWHGMGEFGINSITQSDINGATGFAFFNAVLVLISATLADVLYSALDPRVRV
ncbi:ABC transporter permease [Spelaeicoccus albus]|uniref:Peptide/nickel transport system permease protein n=1 Tax=Spelaeicoccus albus TaxID=1280376 RepID=A0A7Z0D3Z9_9MICO|nr:ABC transporter permease [Spelaeicoccus albus]NYI68458.1 peptide/nickel transport system permease protein [Spelaeicoccus albus]